MSDRERIRRWRTIWHMRLMFAIGVILMVGACVTLLPALWWSNIAHAAAVGLTAWFVFAQVWAFGLLWAWLGPAMRLDGWHLRAEPEPAMESADRVSHRWYYVSQDDQGCAVMDCDAPYEGTCDSCHLPLCTAHLREHARASSDVLEGL